MRLDFDLQQWRSSVRAVDRGAIAVGRAPELIRVRHLNACARATRAMGRDPEALLERVGIPSRCLRNDAALVPVAYFERFLSAACSRAETSAFSYAAAPKDLSSYRGLVAQLAGSTTLRCALKRGDVGTAEITNQAIHVGRWQQKTWVYTVPPGREGSRLAWSPYLLQPLLALVRVAAGKTWWPDRVLLSCSGAREFESLDICSHAHVEFDMDAVAIEVPGEILDRPWPSPLAEDTGADDEGEIPNDLVGALRALLKSFSRDRPLQLSTVAELTGCSARSLQRELHRAGASYTALTQEARFLAAVELLVDTDHTVTDVAYELGYSDPSHFSRAFQRNAGASPRAFRELDHAMV